MPASGVARILKSWIENRRKRATNIIEQSSATPSSSRVMFDEEDNNGLVLGDKYLPVEVLIEIFCHADCKTLLRCQLVCKRWKMLMNHVWHKKTERTLGKPFPLDDEMPWTAYYLACTKKPYERNLVKNHSAAKYSDYWDITPDIRRIRKVDYLFRLLDFDGKVCGTLNNGFNANEARDAKIKRIISISYEHCFKVQTIVLEDEGIHSDILDTYQPPIEVSGEWNGCRWNCSERYQLRVKLFRNDNEMIDEFLFSDVLGEEQNQWLKNAHVFENYGPGLRRITFEHTGPSRKPICEETSYNNEMVGPCVCVRIPEKKF